MGAKLNGWLSLWANLKLPSALLWEQLRIHNNCWLGRLFPPHSTLQNTEKIKAFWNWWGQDICVTVISYCPDQKLEHLFFPFLSGVICLHSSTSIHAPSLANPLEQNNTTANNVVHIQSKVIQLLVALLALMLVQGSHLVTYCSYGFRMFSSNIIL